MIGSVGGGMMGRAAPSRLQHCIDNFLRLVSEPHSDGMPPVNLCGALGLPSRSSASSEDGITFGNGPVCERRIRDWLCGWRYYRELQS